MQVEHYICAIGCTIKMEITEEQFNHIRKSKELLQRILKLETKYDFVAGNYFDLQKNIFESCLFQNMYNSNYENSPVYQHERQITRVMFNYLSTAKQFYDQLHQLKNISGENLEAEIALYLKEFRADEINNFIFEFRNHTQHTDISTLFSIKTGKKFHPKMTQSLVFQYVTIFLNTEDFLQNNDVKKEKSTNYKHRARNYVIESDNDGEKIELTKLIQYFNLNLFKLHQNIRSCLKLEKEQAIMALHTIYQEYKTFAEHQTKTHFEYIPPQNLMKIYNGHDSFVITTNVMKIIDELEKQNSHISDSIICNATDAQMHEWEYFW